MESTKENKKNEPKKKSRARSSNIFQFFKSLEFPFWIFFLSFSFLFSLSLSLPLPPKKKKRNFIVGLRHYRTRTPRKQQAVRLSLCVSARFQTTISFSHFPPFIYTLHSLVRQQQQKKKPESERA